MSNLIGERGRPTFSREVRAVTVLVMFVIAACHGANRIPGAPAPLASSPAGEWVDLHKTTPTDTMVWVLSPSGNDLSLTVHLDASGARHEKQRRYGRWEDGRIADATGALAPALCFMRRPGRDARSCDRYVLDSVRVDGVTVRRLTVRGYAGAHSTGDRVLLERTHRARSSAPALAAPTPDVNAATLSGSGGFHPRSVQPERPSVATHAGTVSAGYAEIETGIELDRASGGEHATQVPTLFKVGLSKRTQLAASFPASSASGVPFGQGDISVGLKWRVTEDRPSIQDVAILPSVKFSTGGVRGTGTTDVSVLLINSRTFGPVGVDLNLGMTWRSGDGTQAPRTSTLWAAAAGIPLRGALGWALECYGLPGTSGPSGSAPIAALLTGPTWVLRPELALDAGIIVPLTGPQPRAAYLGMVANVGRLARSW